MERGPAQPVEQRGAPGDRLVEEVAAAAGIPAPVAGAISAVLADAVERGLGDRDWSDLVVAAEARAGRDLVLGPPPETAGE